MWANPKFPQIACSPDGIVYDPNLPVANKYWLIKIKCAKDIEKRNPLATKESLTKEQWQSFRLTDTDGKLMLKISHKYYYQVQCQTLLFGLRQGFLSIKLMQTLFFGNVQKASYCLFIKSTFVQNILKCTFLGN